MTRSKGSRRKAAGLSTSRRTLTQRAVGRLRSTVVIEEAHNGRVSHPDTKDDSGGVAVIKWTLERAASNTEQPE